MPNPAPFQRAIVLFVFPIYFNTARCTICVDYPPQTSAILNILNTCVCGIVSYFHTFLQYDQELGEAIELEYLRFMPFMNKALARLVQEEYPQYANDADDQVSNVCPLPSPPPGTLSNLELL